MNVPLRIGWIGLGNHSLQNLMPYLTEECRITAVCDIDPVRVQRFNQSYPPAVVYNNFRVMAENETLDAVFCAVSPKVHYEAGLYFALRGIPIFIEKTPCETVKQADELLAAQQKGGSFIQTGFNRRFATGYLMAKEIIERPEFGTITLFSSKFHASPYRNPGYLLTNHLIHHLDLARLLVGELDDLHIWQVMIDSQRVGYHFHAVSKKGTLVSIETSSLQDIHYPMERVEITGIGRMVSVENMRHLNYYQPPSSKDSFSNVNLHEEAHTLAWQPNLGFPFPNDSLGNCNQVHHFIDCVRGEKKSLYTFEDTNKTMHLMNQTLRLMNFSCF